MFIEKSPQDYIKIMMLDIYMIGHKGFIAGGCFKNIFMDKKIKDIDIFFECEEDRIEAETYYDQNEDYNFYYTNDKVKSYKHKQYGTVVELVRSVYGTPEEVLNKFDFTVTKFAYFKKTEVTENDEEEAEGITYKVLVHENFFEHLTLKRTVIDNEIPFPVSTFERIIRYTNYGFYPCKETKKKIIESIHGLQEIPDISAGLYNGLD